MPMTVENGPVNTKALSLNNVKLLLFNHSVLSDSLWPHGLWPARLPSQWDFPGREYWSGLTLLFSRGSSRPRDQSPLLHCWWILLNNSKWYLGRADFLHLSFPVVLSHVNWAAGNTLEEPMKYVMLAAQSLHEEGQRVLSFLWHLMESKN